MSDTTDRLSERYGKPFISPRAAKLIAGVAGLILLGTVAFVGYRYAYEPVAAELVTYEHLAPDLMAVQFTVSMDPGTEATCTIQAMNSGRAQVGFTDVTIPAQEQRHSTHRVEISTQGDAVSAEILNCERA